MTRLGVTALIPTAAKDVVAIFAQSDTGDDEPIFEDAHLIRAVVNEQVTFYKHPLENGRSLVDHRIIQPVTIELSVILLDGVSVIGGLISGGDFVTRAKDVYTQIRNVFIDGTLLSIQTRTNTYRNQILQSMPHEETSTIFDGVTLSFNTSEIQFETANVASSVPEKPEDTNLLARGKQAALDTALGVKDIASGVFGV